MTKPAVELIVHCYAEKIPDFAKLLTAQLSSLLLWPPQRCTVQVSVCWTISDDATFSVLNQFASYFADRCPEIRLKSEPLVKPQLFRRAIGRNLCAKQTEADVVWFIDADYLLGLDCLDTLADKARSGFRSFIVFPGIVNIHKSHRVGDEELARITPGVLFEPDLSCFAPRQEKKAIGGLQIVNGETARNFGYCDQTSWIQPVSEEGGFRNTTEDKVFRSLLGGSTPISLPAVYRCRHSQSAFESSEKRMSQTE